MSSIATLLKGEKGIIKDFDTNDIPLKLIEMGCLPGNTVELVQNAPFKDPLYINIDGSFVAIRRETASHIAIEKMAKE